MDVKYINPFINAAQTVFKTMLNIDAKMGKPNLKNERTTSGDISGIMGLAGDRKGTICISFHDKGALFVFKTLVGEECDSVNSEVVDSIGELTNIISVRGRETYLSISENPLMYANTRTASRWQNNSARIEKCR